MSVSVSLSVSVSVCLLASESVYLFDLLVCRALLPSRSSSAVCLFAPVSVSVCLLASVPVCLCLYLPACVCVFVCGCQKVRQTVSLSVCRCGQLSYILQYPSNARSIGFRRVLRILSACVCVYMRVWHNYLRACALSSLYMSLSSLYMYI